MLPDNKGKRGAYAGAAIGEAAHQLIPAEITFTLPLATYTGLLTHDRMPGKTK